MAVETDIIYMLKIDLTEISNYLNSDECLIIDLNQDCNGIHIFEWFQSVSSRDRIILAL